MDVNMADHSQTSGRLYETVVKVEHEWDGQLSLSSISRARNARLERLTDEIYFLADGSQSWSGHLEESPPSSHIDHDAVAVENIHRAYRHYKSHREGHLKHGQVLNEMDPDTLHAYDAVHFDCTNGQSSQSLGSCEQTIQTYIDHTSRVREEYPSSPSHDFGITYWHLTGNGLNAARIFSPADDGPTIELEGASSISDAVQASNVTSLGLYSSRWNPSNSDMAVPIHSLQSGPNSTTASVETGVNDFNDATPADESNVEHSDTTSSPSHMTGQASSSTAASLVDEAVIWKMSLDGAR